MSFDRIFSRHNSLSRWLLLSSLFSCFLLLIRSAYLWSIGYFFLPWNLLLAIIPFWIARWMEKNFQRLENSYWLYILLLAWLLFIPNSFYIITDLFHLTDLHLAPKWFDILLVFSFAWNGIAFGILSIKSIEKMMGRHWGPGRSFALILIVMWLNGLGIYIGRFLRYNSWDIIARPVELFGSLYDMLMHPVQNISGWAMTITYGIFMTLLYYTISKLGESLQAKSPVPSRSTT